MPMCAVVTRDVEGRYRGFLGSVMLELAPGTYAHPGLNRRTREQIWAVLEDWYGNLGRGSILMTWVDRNAAGGLGLLSLGTPSKDLVDHEGVLLVRRALPAETVPTSVQKVQD